MNSSSKHVFRVIAEMAIFLEFTSDELLNQDVAIEMMEQMATQLQQLNKEDRSDLSRAFEQISHEFSNSSHKTFVQKLGNSLGMND